MKYDYLVVGAGLSGATIAYALKQKGKKVLVVEQRSEVGGNIATHLQDGIHVHAYGPHIFHTSLEDVWNFVNSIVPFAPFVNSPIANYHGELYHLPFNMNTFKELWGISDPEEAKKKIAEETKPYSLIEPKNLEEQALKLVGPTIYKKLIKEYTEKQWGRDCADLPSFIIKRLPLRFEFNNNYFNDPYQGIPEGGFSALINNLLKGIEVLLDTDYLKHKEELTSLCAKTIYTGQLDSFFDYSLGRLEYRSLRFESKILPVDDYQHNPVVNFTSHDFAYTRVCEHKHFDHNCQNHHSTYVTYEYPDTFAPGKIPYYPVNDEKNSLLADAYKEKALTLTGKVYFLGRLANYKYLDMDKTIAEALKLVSCLD